MSYGYRTEVDFEPIESSCSPVGLTPRPRERQFETPLCRACLGEGRAVLDSRYIDSVCGECEGAGNGREREAERSGR